MLYTNISHIRWDYDSGSTVKGIMTVPATKDIRPFAFAKETDPFTVTNDLWAMME